jgi:hypothetical protein
MRDQGALQGNLQYSKSYYYAGENWPATVHGEIYLGAGTIREIARVLTLLPGHEIRIRLTVRATREPSENTMTYDPDGPTYHWTGKGCLYITKAVVVIEHAPISEETEANEGKSTRPIAVGSLAWSLFVAWLVYEAVMHAGSTDAFTWNAGSLGAGTLGAGSISALWMGFLAFMLAQWIPYVCVGLVQAVADLRMIRGLFTAGLDGQERRRMEIRNRALRRS